jgi:5'-3' exonuclease
MARLAVFLRTYVAQRQLTGGPLWRKLAVIIDDSGSPGEGEHKLIDYIRNWRRSSDYSPEMVHAICGQDADLIMLGLSLHEPRVIILRERVDPPKKGKGRKEANKGPKGSTSFASTGSASTSSLNSPCPSASPAPCLFRLTLRRF